MKTQDSKNFSTELSDCHNAGEHVDAVGHPLVKQVLNQVLAEGNATEGSSFGEGGQDAG